MSNHYTQGERVQLYGLLLDMCILNTILVMLDLFILWIYQHDILLFFLGIGFGCYNVSMNPMCLFGYHLFCVSQDSNEYDTVYIYIGREGERESFTSAYHCG